MRFLDRRDAGEHLARRLAHMSSEEPLVIALPRGGVPVAFEVAGALRAPLDVLAVRKLGAPGNPELAVGAIGEDGGAILDEPVAERLGMTGAVLREAIRRELAELHRRVARYRGERPMLDVAGRTVILTDDGLATGLTAAVAVRAVRALHPRRVVLAVPVASRPALALIEREADEVVCLTSPFELLGVGQWYRDFSPTPDEEVLALLEARGSAPQNGEMSRPGRPTPVTRDDSRELQIELDGRQLDAQLILPPKAAGLVIFAHGSGSGRRSPRGQVIAGVLAKAGLGSLLVDLLDESESRRRELVFDTELLGCRLRQATSWAAADARTAALPLGYFGASTGAAAAFRAAAALPALVRGIVSRGGRGDLAADQLKRVRAPALLLVGSRDPEVLCLNRAVAERLRCANRLTVVDGADHLFAAPGTLETAALLAAGWLGGHLQVPATAGVAPAYAD